MDLTNEPEISYIDHAFNRLYVEFCSMIASQRRFDTCTLSLEHAVQEEANIDACTDNIKELIDEIYQDGYRDGYDERQALGDLE